MIIGFTVSQPEATAPMVKAGKRRASIQQPCFLQQHCLLRFHGLHRAWPKGLSQLPTGTCLQLSLILRPPRAGAHSLGEVSTQPASHPVFRKNLISISLFGVAKERQTSRLLPGHISSVWGVQADREGAHGCYRHTDVSAAVLTFSAPSDGELWAAPAASMLKKGAA